MSLLLDIASAAEAQNLRFLVIGGHAVISHGFQRSTFDLDLLAVKSEREKWSALLGKLGQTQISETPTFLQFEAAHGLGMPVDVLLTDESTFEKLDGESVPVDAQEPIRTVSLAHLIALKCHAIKFGHAGRIEKDVDDLIGLGKVNKLNWQDAEWREIVLKHGIPELLEKLQHS